MFYSSIAFKRALPSKRALSHIHLDPPLYQETLTVIGLVLLPVVCMIPAPLPIKLQYLFIVKWFVWATILSERIIGLREINWHLLWCFTMFTEHCFEGILQVSQCTEAVNADNLTLHISNKVISPLDFITQKILFVMVCKVAITCMPVR